MSSELPPLPALRAFEAAARLGTLARAAAELHVTHGAVSRHIRTLEEALGTPLFQRQGRGMVLTGAGERLRDASGEAFARLRQGWSELRRAGGDAPLVLGCSGSVLARWVIPRLDRLAQELPGLRLHLAAQEQAPGPDLDGVDAALLLAAPPWPASWRVRVLAEERIGPVLSPRLPGAEQLAGAAPEALRQWPLLQTQSRPQAWPEWAATVGVDMRALRAGREFEHLLYLLEAGVAGLGVAIAPEPLVAEELASGRLIAPWGFAATPGRWILCTDARNGDRRIDALADWLTRELTGAQPRNK